MLLKLWCFLGFRRVLRKNVLESDERKNLYESITENPGVDLSSLTEMLRLNKETARYHLKMLAVNGKISGLIKQGIARYFPSREMISEFEKTVIHYLWIGTTKRILLLLIETPGLTRQAIADELGIAGPSVTWQMQRLADDGLIEVRTEGRFVRYFLTPDSADVLESVKKPEGLTGRGIT
jgi:predicted transcriptional regulator